MTEGIPMDEATMRPETVSAQRPRRYDAPVLKAAAVAFAAVVASDGPDYLDGATPEQFAQDLLACLPLADEGGVELAQALERRSGYAFDAEAVELMGRWPQELRSSHEAAIRTWVRDADPSAPFEELARVRVNRRGSRHHGEGTAYREDRHDQLAQCLVVTDADRARHMRDGAFAGGYIIDWEDIEVLGEATDADRAAHVAKLEQVAALRRERTCQDHARALDRAFAQAEAKVEAEIASMGDAGLGVYLSRVLEGLASDVAQPGFDPFGERAAQAFAALRKAQKRARRASFLAAEASAAGKPGPEAAG